MKHIIIDTDIGYDPDDVFALALALKSSEFKIELIVTNDECNGKRIKVLDKFLDASGYSNILIAEGIDLGNENFVADDFIKNYINKKHNADFVKAIKEVVEKNEKIYYVSLGALTNLAAFLKNNHNLADKIEVICMIGVKDRIRPEHNLKLDIVSASRVLESGVAINMVTANITVNEQIRLCPNSDLISKFKKSKENLHQCIYQLTEPWFKNKYPETYMHDPITLSYLINYDFLVFKKEKIQFTENANIKRDNEGFEVSLSVDADYKNFMKFLRRKLLE